MIAVTVPIGTVILIIVSVAVIIIIIIFYVKRSSVRVNCIDHFHPCNYDHYLGKEKGYSTRPTES